MDLKQAEVRAINLIKNGRFEKKVTTDSNAFQKTDLDKSVTLEGIEFIPYFDPNKNMLIYGASIVKEGVSRFYYLTFSKTDYFYGNDDAFFWVDIDRFKFFE